MIDEHSHREMRAVGSDRDRAVINDCGWKDGTSLRKALLIIPGDSGRMLTLTDLHEAVNSGLSATAKAGNGSSLVDIVDVIQSYNTDKELPVLFVYENESGEEILSMFLYDMPIAA